MNCPSDALSKMDISTGDGGGGIDNDTLSNNKSTTTTTTTTTNRDKTSSISSLNSLLNKSLEKSPPFLFTPIINNLDTASSSLLSGTNHKYLVDNHFMSNMPVPPIVPFATVSSGTSNSSSTHQKTTQNKKSKFTGVNDLEADVVVHETTSNGGEMDSPNGRRQRRLERNRESARVSRRRRKQYLQVLEEKVTKLSEEMDKGRRSHVANAIPSLSHLRRVCLEELERGLNAQHDQDQVAALEKKIKMLDHQLSRACNELRLVAEFQKEQLKSLTLPPHTRFILWLTLQNDECFRGGRSASERLSAARIGEKMLNSGTDHASPAGGMWPLICHEVGFSYEQEDRIRTYQRTLLTDSDTFLHRHSARAGMSAINASNKSIIGASEMIKQTEMSTLDVLSIEQRVRFSVLAQKRKDLIKRLFANSSKNTGSIPCNDRGDEMVIEETISASVELPIDYNNHQMTVDLVSIDQRLQNLAISLPQVQPVVNISSMKKLSRRPSFESLASVHSKDGLSLSGHPSTGSLRKNISSGTLKDDLSSGHQIPVITPEEAQKAAASVIGSVLGSLSRSVVVQSVTSSTVSTSASQIVDPVLSIPASSFEPTSTTSSNHHASNSFSDGAANNPLDELLMNLDDDDWAIGGFDDEMDPFEQSQAFASLG